MTFEEWWTQRETVAGCALKGADNAEAAWEAGYHQGRLYEGAWKTARLMDNELFGRLKKHRTFRNTKTGELIHTNLSETVDDFSVLLDPNDYVEEE